jgi:hypothetical protein
VVATNVTPEGCDDEVGWGIFTFEKTPPLAGASVWDVGKVGKEWSEEHITLFRRYLPHICRALAALESITPEDVQGLNVSPKPPHRAHGETRVPRDFTDYLKGKGFVTDEELEASLQRLEASPDVSQEVVLGQGDFEVSHLHIRNDGTVVLTDNEFGGWYPRLDSLTYCYHRLWANRRQPHLAQELLTAYLANHVPASERDAFFTQFVRILLPRVIRGFYYDATRRHLDPQAENQVRRRELFHTLFQGNKERLTRGT